MNNNHDDIPWLGADFFENQHKFPPEELLKYGAQHIAWSWDGARILASAADYESLDQKLREAGIDPSRVVHDYVDDPNVSYLG
jgi:hypothetical protein